jgi:sec-independent protein translocase protein TatA
MITSSAIFAAGIFGFGAGELVVILIILLVMFGGSKLPSLARGLGESIKEFKKSSREDEPTKPGDDAKKAEPAKTHGSN